MKTVLAYDDIFLQHQTGNHPERPQRLNAIIETLKNNNMWEKLTFPTQLVEPDKWIRANHSQTYIDRLQDACRNRLPTIDCPDSAISAESYLVARQAVAYTLAALDLIMSGDATNGFCPVRPPGHHAEYDKSMGFCLFNNIAIAVRYLKKHHKLRKILILDWDVHHGNGTQHSFENDDSVFYCSIHQHPLTCYPGTGYTHETGSGNAVGCTMNLPLEPGAADTDCLDVFKNTFLPVAKEFKPDFVLISAGFDAHKMDPLAQLNLTEESYIVLTKEMKKFAENHCNGRIMSLLEGGYHLEALSNSVAEHLGVLLSE